MRKTLGISIIVILILAVLLLLLLTHSPQHVSPIIPQSSPTRLSSITKVNNCRSINSLPDPGCTPGATDPRVTQDTIQQTICKPNYTETVRPPVSYTEKVKKEEMQAYGYTDDPKNYELDHLIPLELGGNPTDTANLWPEPAFPTPGFHEKDSVENSLHQKVCNGEMTLAAAQIGIATNWLAFYH